MLLFAFIASGITGCVGLYLLWRILHELRRDNDYPIRDYEV